MKFIKNNGEISNYCETQIRRDTVSLSIRNYQIQLSSSYALYNVCTKLENYTKIILE